MRGCHKSTFVSCILVVAAPHEDHEHPSENGLEVDEEIHRVLEVVVLPLLEPTGRDGHLKTEWYMVFSGVLCCSVVCFFLLRISDSLTPLGSLELLSIGGVMDFF